MEIVNSVIFFAFFLTSQILFNILYIRAYILEIERITFLFLNGRKNRIMGALEPRTFCGVCLHDRSWWRMPHNPFFVPLLLFLTRFKCNFKHRHT